MKSIHTFVTFGCLALGALACGGTTDDPGSDPIAAGADLLYVGECTPDACDGLAVPDLGCASGEPRYICGAAQSGQCTITVDCSADPDGTTSFAPCGESECGPLPTEPDSACPDGYAWGAAQCGKLNDAKACAWANGCVKQPTPGTKVDPSKVGKACGVDDQQNTISCEDGTGECVTLPAETGIEGAHCVQDPCALIGCPVDKCVQLESYPAQVQCQE